MFRKIFLSFSVALQNIRSNPLHTMLSTLGIMIGVAALVSILALVDGMERFAREQITQTTSLKSIIVETVSREYINGVWVDKESYPLLSEREARELESKFSGIADIRMSLTRSDAIKWGADSGRVGGYVEALGTIPVQMEEYISQGRGLERKDITGARKVAVVSRELGLRIAGEQPIESAIGIKITTLGDQYKIAGVLEETGRGGRYRVYLPLSSVAGDITRESPPRIVVEAGQVEQVPVLEQEVKTYLKNRYEAESAGFRIRTQAARVEQANQGLMLFKLVMGLITGISVVVGGIGVMNVLLVSVTERTPEIGIRKAAGAKKRDIMMQFLSESVTVSGLGSLVGLLFGIVFTLVFIPVIKQFTDVPFQAVFTLDTLLIIGLLALAVGIVFGTYPAVRAARLTPVEAIRRE